MLSDADAKYKVRQWIGRFGNGVFSWIGWSGEDATTATQQPTGAQRAFAVKAFYKNGDSFVIAQREFRREFGIHRNRAVPSAHAIKTWVQNFEATGSTLKKKVVV